MAGLIVTSGRISSSGRLWAVQNDTRWYAVTQDRGDECAELNRRGRPDFDTVVLFDLSH